MPKRRPNHRLVKIHRSYTVEEIACSFGIHKNTVRSWVKNGLPVCDRKRPALILGRDLAAYLKTRREKNKRPCQPGEIYCVRCRAPKRPAGDMAEYRPTTESLGNLTGICPDCEGMIYRRSSKVKLAEIQGKLDITFARAEQQGWPDDMARTNSQFVRDFVVTQAARMNLTPEAFFDKYRYTIEAASGDLRGKLAQSFIQAPDGEFHFGEITPEIADAIGAPAGKIRLTPEGLDHLNGHLEELGKKGFASAQEFADYVGKNFTQIYERASRDGQYALDLVISDPVRGRMVVTLKHDPEGHYYNIETSHLARPGQYKNRQPLWERTGPSTPSAKADSLFPKAIPETKADDDILHQAAQRGGFDPSTLTTLLGKKADMSTFLHETAHYFLSVYSNLAKEGAPGVSEDFGKLLHWFGVKDQAAWDAMPLEEQRKHHEQFAYSYEKYLAEGKAPSIEAQGVFDRFTQWLKRVYKSVRDDTNTIYRQQHGEDLPILTGEVRDVMDRMLASDEQIRQAEAIRNMEPVFQSQTASRMNDAEWKAYGN